MSACTPSGGDFSIESAGFVAFVGPSGSGKREPYWVSGYLQGTFEHFLLDRDSALYGLNFPDGQRRHFQHYCVTGNMSGQYRWDDATLNGRLQAEWWEDVFGGSDDITVQEVYLSHRASDRLPAEVGKRTLRWAPAMPGTPSPFLSIPRTQTPRARDSCWRRVSTCRASLGRCALWCSLDCRVLP